MWESDLATITLLDVIDTHEVSVRTGNCIKTAMDQGYLPIKTVDDYLRAGNKAKVILLSIPNMGLKSVNEIDSVIQDICVAKGINKLDINSQGSLVETNAHVASLSIDEIVASNNTSVRLRNGINEAKTEGELPFETVGEYMKAGFAALSIMQTIPNIGKNSARELDGLIRSVLARSAISSDDTNELNTALEDTSDPHDDVIFLRISDIVEANLLSERLRNGIEKAISEGELPFSTVGEYIKAGSRAIPMMRI